MSKLSGYYKGKLRIYIVCLFVLLIGFLSWRIHLDSSTQYSEEWKYILKQSKLRVPDKFPSPVIHTMGDTIFIGCISLSQDQAHQIIGLNAMESLSLASEKFDFRAKAYNGRKISSENSNNKFILLGGNLNCEWEFIVDTSSGRLDVWTRFRDASGDL